MWQRLDLSTWVSGKRRVRMRVGRTEVEDLEVLDTESVVVFLYGLELTLCIGWRRRLEEC